MTQYAVRKERGQRAGIPVGTAVGKPRKGEPRLRELSLPRRWWEAAKRAILPPSEWRERREPPPSTPPEIRSNPHVIGGGSYKDTLKGMAVFEADVSFYIPNDEWDDFLDWLDYEDVEPLGPYE